MENKVISPHLPVSMLFNDIIITEKSRMASLLNHHFINATHTVTMSNPNATHTVPMSNPNLVSMDTSVTTSADAQLSPSSNNGFSFMPLSTSEVQDELSKLNTNKSAGLDGLDPMFLKAASRIIAAPVTRLFNMSLQLSEFPIDWKSAIIFPLFKGGSESDPDCYRPNFHPTMPCQSSGEARPKAVK